MALWSAVRKVLQWARLMAVQMAQCLAVQMALPSEPSSAGLKALQWAVLSVRTAASWADQRAGRKAPWWAALTARKWAVQWGSSAPL